MRHILCPGLASIAALVTGAAGDGPIIVHEDSSHYSYRMVLLPDVDQRRIGLPNDGDMYCVPTALLNLCAYAGNHGFDDEVLCDDFAMLYYHWPAFYDDVTDLVDLLGTFMATDAYDGTDGYGALLGASIAMSGGFTVKQFSRKSDFWPNYDHMASWALGGALVMPVVGWYPPGSGARDGGHAMAVARLQRNDDNRILGVHDPASGDDLLYSQSPVTREDYGITREIRFSGGAPWLVDRLEGYGGGGKVAIIDGFYAFIPHHAYVWTDKGIVAPITPDTPWQVSEPMQLSLGSILSLQQDSLTHTLYVLQESVESKISQVDVIGQTETVVLELPDMQDFIVTPLRRLYVLTDYTDLRCYLIRSPQLILESQVTTPAPMSEIAYDAWANEIVGLSIETQEIVTWSSDLVAPPRVSALPAPLNGEPSLTVNPVDGTIWFTSTESEHIWGIDRDGPPILVLEHALIENVQNLSLAPNDNLLFGDGSATHEITPAGVIVPDSKWSVLAGADAFIPNFETNYDDSMTGPAWRNVLPDEFAPSIPACLADIDGDAIVGVGDLLGLLARWGSTSLHADITMDGVVDVADLLVILATWGPCE